jgi:hypothetical protein
MKKTAQIFTASIVLFFSLFGCKPKEKSAPEFPPETEISIDFSFFIMPSETTGNYVRAFETTSYWANLLNDSLELYRNMLSSVQEKGLKYQDKNTWLLSKTLYQGDKQYDINYFEIVHEDSVETKLFFTQDSSYTNLLLFDGYFFTDSAPGYRQINKPDTSNTYTKFLKAEWHISSATKKDIKFTNILLNSDKNGNSVFYKDSVDGNYNVYLDFFEKADDRHIYIEYNKTNFAGRIKDEQFYGDMDWHCWNTERADTDCPVK